MENVDFSLDVVSNKHPGKVSEQERDAIEPQSGSSLWTLWCD